MNPPQVKPVPLHPVFLKSVKKSSCNGVPMPTITIEGVADLISFSVSERSSGLLKKPFRYPDILMFG